MITGTDTATRIGRYEVLRRLACGGMAELFLARFFGPGGFEKRCALKRVLPQFARDPNFTRMFLTEARVAALFDHPNLAQVFELGQEPSGQYYIAMELVNGVDLRQLLEMAKAEGVAVPPALAAHIIAQALDGLAHVHGFRDEDGVPLHLVHRDVSPQNILVAWNGAVKVVDFGIVKSATTSGETTAGALKGKVAYMSPEQAAGAAVDARSDLFSMGVCLYELIAGARPFDAPTDVATLRAILDRQHTPIEVHRPDCPEALAQIIDRALVKRAEERYASAREMALALVRVTRHCPLPPSRHVVAEFLASLVAPESVAFDPGPLELPRPAPLASGPSSLVLPSPAPEPTPAPLLSAPQSPPDEPHELGPPPLPATRRPPPEAPRRTPGSLAITFLSALAGALLVLTWVAHSRSARIEVQPLPGDGATALQVGQRGSSAGPAGAASTSSREGAVRVVARPEAEVWVGGALRGKTPLRVVLPQGRHELRLVTAAGDERTQAVNVGPGEEEEVQVDF